MIMYNCQNKPMKVTDQTESNRQKLKNCQIVTNILKSHSSMTEENSTTAK